MNNTLRLTFFFILAANFTSITLSKMRASSGIGADIVLLNELAGQKGEVDKRGFGGIAGISLVNSFSYGFDAFNLPIYIGGDIDFRYSGLAQFGINKPSDKFNSFKESIESGGGAFKLISLKKTIKPATSSAYTVVGNSQITENSAWKPEAIRLQYTSKNYKTADAAKKAYKSAVVSNADNLGAVLIQKSAGPHQSASIAHKELFNVKLRPFIGYELSSLLPKKIAGIDIEAINIFADIGPTVGYSLYNNVFHSESDASIVKAPTFLEADKPNQDSNMQFRLAGEPHTARPFQYTGADLKKDAPFLFTKPNIKPNTKPNAHQFTDHSTNYLSLGIGLSGGVGYSITNFLDVSVKLKYALDGIFNISKKSTISGGTLSIAPSGPNVVAYKFLADKDAAKNTVTYTYDDSIKKIIALQTGFDHLLLKEHPTQPFSITYADGAEKYFVVKHLDAYVVPEDAKLSEAKKPANAYYGVFQKLLKSKKSIKIGGDTISVGGAKIYWSKWGFIKKDFPKSYTVPPGIDTDNQGSSVNNRIYIDGQIVGSDSSNNNRMVKKGMIVYASYVDKKFINDANMRKIKQAFINNAKAIMSDSIKDATKSAAIDNAGIDKEVQMQLFAPRFSYEESEDAEFKKNNVGSVLSHTISLSLGASYVF